jgi:hypothetical protein
MRLSLSHQDPSCNRAQTFLPRLSQRQKEQQQETTYNIMRGSDHNLCELEALTWIYRLCPRLSFTQASHDDITFVHLPERVDVGVIGVLMMSAEGSVLGTASCPGYLVSG